MQGGATKTSAGDTNSSALEVASISAQKKEQIMQVGIKKILSDYRENEVSADNKYKGRLVQVGGTVNDIKKDFRDSLYVTIGTGAAFEMPTVQAFFDDSMNQQLASLRKSQKLAVVCRVKGLMVNVLMEDCLIK
jgi:hypothetical protein